MSDSEDSFVVSDDDDFEAPKKKAKKAPKEKAAPKQQNGTPKKAAKRKADDLDSSIVMTAEDRAVFTNVDTAKKGELTIEKIYQKKSQLEHILLRPDTYIGSVEYTDKEMMWVYDSEREKLVQREIRYVPGLYKIFDEILVNAADNKQRDAKMNVIKIEIDKEKNRISVFNNGKGIPVAHHKVENMWVPELIFGTLLTSSNYNDAEKKVTGGRNGYGAKLCNIFSTEFTLETSSREYKTAFKQTWINNMTKDKNAQTVPAKGEDYTKVTFKPDLAKFKMTELDDDIIALMSRRAFDVAGTTRGVKVYLNGKLVPVNGFKQYVEQYTRDVTDLSGEPIKVCYEQVNDRWEVALCVSEKGFQQVSFANSIATTKGGRHVDYVADQITSKLIETIRKKAGKSSVNVKPFQVKNHMWVFVNALIENPTFDSQTKETMTLQAKAFGSKCELGDKFCAQALKCGVVDAVLSWVRFKQMEIMDKKCSTKKTSKLKGIAKLEDANDAGTKNSMFCTLILTEGDSAKTLAVSGLGVVGRDRYGVFPLRGKLLNVRDGNAKQIAENIEINNLIKILGLQYKKKYDSDEDMKSLRYGKVMVMADQDQDGSHIKGLVINFIHHNWPSLIRRNFVEEFITPIVKATKGKEEISFFSIPEYNEWRNATDNWKSYKIKYYKGLGTSTSKEAKEYFSDMQRHRIRFKYAGNDDDDAVIMAFSKKKIDERKEWLTKWMEEKKERRTRGLEEDYLYEKDTRAVTFADFVNKELVLFSNTDNERSIPSLVDGLKPGQRKVIFACFKRADKREVKVAQLAGAVGELTAYHHGEASLMGTIVNLAQDFVGSNNINLLLPIGQFGTRLQGGKDSASPRYIFTMLNPVARSLFPPADDNVLRFLFEDNQRIEPEWYCPIIPMVLINGADGIGTGWATHIPNYNPRDVVENMRRLIRGEPLKAMKPWFKNFRGDVRALDATRFVCSGEVAMISDETFEITELPIKTWTQSYKESVLEPFMESTDKKPAAITDFKEYHTDTTATRDKLRAYEMDGIHKMFKLQSVINTTSMVLFDASGCLRRYNSPEEICAEFFDVRKAKYVERKAFLEGMLQAQSDRLSNQARFILAKIKGEILMENKKKANIVEQLIKKGFDPDPVKRWKAEQQKRELEMCGEVAPDDDEQPEQSDEEEESAKKPSDVKKVEQKLSDYDYLVGMALIKLSEEEKDKLLRESEAKLEELKQLKAKSWSDLWMSDLDNFLVELKKQEDKEKADAESNIKTAAKKFEKTDVKNKRKSGAFVKEVFPSKDGLRVEPVIDKALKEKYEKMNEPKKERKPKEPKPPKEPKDPKEPKVPNKSKDPFDSPKKKKKDEWHSDASSDEEDMFLEDHDETAFGESDEDDDGEIIVKKTTANDRKARLAKRVSDEDSKQNGVIMLSDDENEESKPPVAQKKEEKKEEKKKPAPAKPKAAAKKETKPKKETSAKLTDFFSAKGKKKSADSDNDDDDDDDDDVLIDDDASPVAPRAKSGRATATKRRYDYDESSDEEVVLPKKTTRRIIDSDDE